MTLPYSDSLPKELLALDKQLSISLLTVASIIGDEATQVSEVFHCV